jgi:ERCC4-related helicase
MATPTHSSATLRYAPGARVEVRDEEWMVRRVEPSTTGGHALTVVGVSELVRGSEAIFLDDLDTVTVLDPRETLLESDPSPGYRKTRLYLESLLRQSPVTGSGITTGHRGAIRPSRYQLEPAGLALAQARARILIADGVGLGKTVEVGVLLSELIRRGRGRRILVVALRSVLEQFQMELWSRFTIPLVRLDSAGIERVQRRIPANMNPFYVYDRVIISIDTLKRDEKYRRFLSACRWDAIVIDECQHVAERSVAHGSVSQRARLAKLLASTADALILTSATPHDGRPESFASLMNLLDPTAVPDVAALEPETVKRLVVRRFKKDIEHEVGEQFRDRELIPHRVSANPHEEALLDALAQASFRTIGRTGTGSRGALFQTLLRKAALSSSNAVASTIDNRLAELLRSKKVAEADAKADRATLQHLHTLANQAKTTAKHPASKLAALVELLRGFQVQDAAADNRVVVFSERIDTLNMLADELPKRLGLSPTSIGRFQGSSDDDEQQTLVREFGNRESPLRVLLCSDAAAEGINLHFYCHRLVHFDIPWSFITLEQRNGRIDRFGQKHKPEIHVLLTISSNETVRGDMRVLERLVEKEAEAHKTLGDVRALLELHDAAAEEQRIIAGIEAGERAEDIIPELDAIGSDFLADLLAVSELDKREHTLVETRERASLFADDLSFCLDGWRELADNYEDVARPIEHPDASGIEITAPEDLQLRCEQLPAELIRESGHRFKLTTDREFLMREFQRARERESGWPSWHLLWDQHPINEWLTDRLVAHMTRHAAPVIRVARGLEAGQRCFVFQGVLSNHRSQAVLCAWFGVLFDRKGKPGDTLDWDALVSRTGLDKPVPNDGARIDTEPLLALRTSAVAAALTHMSLLRKQRGGELEPLLKTEIRRLSKWSDARLDTLDEQIQAETRAARKAKLEQQKADVELLAKQRADWFNDTMTTEDQPYLRLAAVLFQG